MSHDINENSFTIDNRILSYPVIATINNSGILSLQNTINENNEPIISNIISIGSNTIPSNQVLVSTGVNTAPTRKSQQSYNGELLVVHNNAPLTFDFNDLYPSLKEEKSPDEKLSEDQDTDVGPNDNDATTCRICMAHTVKVMPINCKHLAYCIGCYKKLHECAICKGPVKSYITVHLP